MSIGHDRGREAVHSIRGYVYQAFQSVAAWMRLRDGELLFLEGAEDFDIHTDGGVVATQVANTSGPLTLRTAKVIAAINNVWRHGQSNPDKNVTLRFLATAKVGLEQGVVFPGGLGGLDFWEEARNADVALDPLQAFLLTQDLDVGLKAFIGRSDDSVLREGLIHKIHWDTGSKPMEALIDDINDRLVCHGQSRGVDSRASESVLGHLLYRVAQLMGSTDERRLTLADFHRSFDDATMELMPRGEASSLRSLAYGQHNPAALTHSSPVLEGRLPLVQGAVLREGVVSRLAQDLKRHRALFLHGSTGLGKTNLAWLVTDLLDGEWAWVGFRGLDSSLIADRLRRAKREVTVLGMAPFLVLDDIDLSVPAAFERELLALIFSVVNAEGMVVVTGPAAPPRPLLDKAWLSHDCDQPAPYLEADEITALAHAYGCDPAKAVTWSRLILATTRGHPQLAHARVVGLQQRGWPDVSQNDLIDRGDIEQDLTSARRRLVAEITSEGARHLAYRLSLTVGSFPRHVAVDIARVPPPIALSGEAFDRLVGPWIERTGNDRFRVSPLLAGAAEQNLSPQEGMAIHEAIALSYLNQREISGQDFGSALMHALVAKSHDALLIATSGMMRYGDGEMRHMAEAAPWFAMMALQPGETLFPADPAMEFILRLAQFRVAAGGECQEAGNTIILRTLDVLSQFGGETWQTSAITAYGIFLNSVEISIPAALFMAMLSSFMDLTATDAKLGEIARSITDLGSGHPLNGLTTAQVFFSTQSVRIGDTEDLGAMLDALDALPPAKRDHLLEVFQRDPGFASALLQRVCWKETEVPSFAVNQAISRLRQVAEQGRRWSVPSLAREAILGIAALLDESGAPCHAALAVADEAEAELGSHCDIDSQRTKILFHHKDFGPALASARRALAGPQLPALDRAFTGRTAGICAAELGDWAVAEAFFLDGAEQAGTASSLGNMMIGLRADAAFARWQQGRKAEALSLYAEVLERLEAIPVERDLKCRTLHAAVRYCVGYLHAKASGATDAAHISPPPGMCSRLEVPEGIRDSRVVDLPGIWGLLGATDTILGTGLAIAQRVEARFQQQIPPIARIMGVISEFKVCWGNGEFEGLVPFAVSLIEAMFLGQQLEAAGGDPWNPQDKAPVSSDCWIQEGRLHSLLELLLCAALDMTARSPMVALPIDPWRQHLASAGMTEPNVLSFLEILRGATFETNGELLEESALGLAALRSPVPISPQDRYRHHIRLLTSVASGGWRPFADDAIGKLVADGWLYVIRHQRLFLRTPAISCPLLQDACGRHDVRGVVKAATILEVATGAVRVNPDQRVRDMLGRLRRGG